MPDVTRILAQIDSGDPSPEKKCPRESHRLPIVFAALDKESAEELSHYLDKASVGNAELRERVEQLPRASEQSSNGRACCNRSDSRPSSQGADWNANCPRVRIFSSLYGFD
jgi:hypothetical protein